jgi:hypothetical protein
MHRVVLQTHQDGGNFLTGFTKIVVAEVLKSYLFEQAVAPETGSTDVSEEEKREKLFHKLHAYRKEMLDLQTQGNLMSDLVSLGKLGLKDPFITADSTNPAIAGIQTIALLKDVIGYDDNTGRIQISLDPSLLANRIYGAKNNLQLWNLLPLYDNKMNQTYLEVAVGNNTRTDRYLDFIDQRPEREASDLFTGIHGTRDKVSPVDYSLELDFESFQNAVNSILSESIDEHKESAKQALSSFEEGSQYLLEDIAINATGKGQLGVTVTMAEVVKKKRGFLRRFFSGSDARHSIETTRTIVTAEVGLSVESIKKYRDQITLGANEVLLSDKLIRVDLRRAGYKTGNSGIVNGLINMVAGNVNLASGFLGKKIKNLILKIAGPMLNPQGEKNGNAVLGGFHINDFVKIFTSTEEILLQVNPRFAGAMWDFYFLENENFYGKEIGLNINEQTGKIKIDFASALSITAMDKKELIAIMENSLKITEEMTNPKLAPKNPGEWIIAVDNLVLRSDVLRPSLYVRFKNLLENYDSIIDVSLNGNQEGGNRFVNLTASGAELMHIAAAASVLAEAMKHTAIQIESSGHIGLTNHVQNIKAASQRLKSKYVKPLADFYQKKYNANNKKIMSKKITDWNSQFYSDAIFATKIYETIK